MPLSDDDYRDIQGLVRFGYKHLKAARFHLLTIADAAAARAWLANAPVTTAVKGRPPETALHVAFTLRGAPDDSAGRRTPWRSSRTNSSPE